MLEEKAARDKRAANYEVLAKNALVSSRRRCRRRRRRRVGASVFAASAAARSLLRGSGSMGQRETKRARLRRELALVRAGIVSTGCCRTPRERRVPSAAGPEGRRQAAGAEEGRSSDERERGSDGSDDGDGGSEDEFAAARAEAAAVSARAAAAAAFVRRPGSKKKEASPSPVAVASTSGCRLSF